MTGGAFTIETLRAVQKKFADLPQPSLLKIMVSAVALKDSDVRLFPASKHRSRRIHKKLIKRHGGEFLKVPCILKTPQCIIMHPTLYDQFQTEMARRQDSIFLGALLGDRVPG